MGFAASTSELSANTKSGLPGAAKARGKMCAKCLWVQQRETIERFHEADGLWKCVEKLVGFCKGMLEECFLGRERKANEAAGAEKHDQGIADKLI